MLNERKMRTHVAELLILYGVTLFLGFLVGWTYHSSSVITYITALIGVLLIWFSIFLPFKLESDVAVFVFFAVAALACWRSPEMSVLLLVSSIILTKFPVEPKQYKVNIIVCGIIMLLFVNNFIPLLVLYTFLMGLDLLLELLEYAKTTEWKMACMMHTGRTKWMYAAFIVTILGAVKYCVSFQGGY